MAEVDTEVDVAPMPNTAPDNAAQSSDIAAPATFVPNASRPSVVPPPDLPAKS